MMILFVLVSLLPLAFALLNAENDLHHLRLRRKGKYALDWLMEITGLRRRREVERIVGRPGPDQLYEMSVEVFAKLPRNRWARGPRQPVLNGLALVGLIAAIVESLVRGRPAWAALAIFGGYETLCALWELAVLILRPRDRGDDRSTPAGLDPLEAAQVETLSGLKDAFQKMREAEESSYRREMGSQADSPFWKWVSRRASRRNLRDLDRQLVDLEEERARIEQLRRQCEHLLTRVRWRIVKAQQENARWPNEAWTKALEGWGREEKRLEEMIRTMDHLLSRDTPS